MRQNMIRQITFSAAMQLVILAVHLLIHRIELNDKHCIFFSFIGVILITYLTALIFKLPAYTAATTQIVTLLFLWFTEEEGVYLLYYLHRGASQWFNPDILTDSLIISLEMCTVQFFSVISAKLSRTLFENRQKRKK